LQSPPARADIFPDFLPYELVNLIFRRPAMSGKFFRAVYLIHVVVLAELAGPSKFYLSRFLMFRTAHESVRWVFTPSDLSFTEK